MARLPQPPITTKENELHRSQTDVINYLRETFDDGVKFPAFTQTQIDSFTDISFIGTILLNNTTGEANISKRDPGDATKVVWIAIT